MADPSANRGSARSRTIYVFALFKRLPRQPLEQRKHMPQHEDRNVGNPNIMTHLHPKQGMEHEQRLAKIPKTISRDRKPTTLLWAILLADIK